MSSRISENITFVSAKPPAGVRAGQRCSCGWKGKRHGQHLSSIRINQGVGELRHHTKILDPAR